jgi:hypothetical protein
MIWTENQTKKLRMYFRNTDNSLLVTALGHTRSGINHKALELGLYKNYNPSRTHYVTNIGRKYTTL